MVKQLQVDPAPLSVPEDRNGYTHSTSGPLKPVTQGERAFLDSMRRRHSDPSKLAKIEARMEDDRRNPAFF
ncbi:MAG: hypothetical protein U0414_37260 [Polyangiaceae bacterium]